MKWLLALSVFILFLVVVISYVEASKNEHFNSVLDVVYFTMVTIATVGYGDITPVTTAGKLLTVILISIGVVIISVMTGSIASILTASKIREGMGAIDTFEKERIFHTWLFIIVKDLPSTALNEKSRR